MARSTRRTVLERVADRSALLLGSHFAGPTGVYLKPDGEAWLVDQAGSAEDGTKVPSPAGTSGQDFVSNARAKVVRLSLSVAGVRLCATRPTTRCAGKEWVEQCKSRGHTVQ